MKKLLIFSLLLLTLSGFTKIYSQNNFIKGYIITLNHDTINGLINYKQWNFNPKVIQFKKDINSHITNYKANEINFFYANNELYIGKIIPIDYSPVKLEELSYSTQENFITDTIFLNVVLQGRTSLYSLNDHNSKFHFFIEKNDIGITELLNQFYLKDIQGKTIIQHFEKYKGQLNIYLSDCPSIFTKIIKCNFNFKDLQGLIAFYNTSQNASITYKKINEKAKIVWGVTGGLSYTQVKFTGSGDYLSKMNFSSSYNPIIGISLSYHFPRNLNKWSIYNELIFKSYSSDGSYTDYHNENYYTTYNNTVGGSYLKLTNMLRYQFVKCKIKPFLSVGICNSIVINKKNSRVTETKFYSEHTFKNGTAVGEYKHMEQSVVAALGGDYKNFSMELRYESGNGFSNYRNVISKINSFNLLIGYHF